MTTGTPRIDRAAATRAAILASAGRRFERDGYERTTIRAIARDARTDPALVMRHFGSKQELFAAASTVDLRLSLFEGVPRRRLGQALAEHFLETWEVPATGRPLRILLTTAAVDPQSAARIQQVFLDQLLPAVAKVRDDPERCAGLIASQFLGFALCRYVISLPPVATMDRTAAAEWLGPAIQRHLDHPAPSVPSMDA